MKCKGFDIAIISLFLLFHVLSAIRWTYEAINGWDEGSWYTFMNVLALIGEGGYFYAHWLYVS